MSQQYLDPSFVQSMMRHAAGRGIEPVPSVGGSLGQQHYHINKPKTGNGKSFGNELVDELKKKIIDI